MANSEHFWKMEAFDDSDDDMDYGLNMPGIAGSPNMHIDKGKGPAAHNDDEEEEIDNIVAGKARERYVHDRYFAV